MHAMPSLDLYQYSIEKLAAQQGSWPEIARECAVSYSWLCKFANNKIPNAAYVRVQRIAGYLQELKPDEDQKLSA
jgi:hypothetical protein